MIGIGQGIKFPKGACCYICGLRCVVCNPATRRPPIVSPKTPPCHSSTGSFEFFLQRVSDAKTRPCSRNIQRMGAKVSLSQWSHTAYNGYSVIHTTTYANKSGPRIYTSRQPLGRTTLQIFWRNSCQWAQWMVGRSNGCRLRTNPRHTDPRQCRDSAGLPIRRHGRTELARMWVGLKPPGPAWTWKSYAWAAG